MYYEQIHGTTMGSPINPTMVNLFMEEFEIKAINSASHPPSLCLRYMDKTFFIQKAEYSNQSLHHINSIDPHIQFTQETPVTEDSIPFLDSLASPEPDNTLLTTVYRNPTHTDHNLPWDS